MVTVPDKIVLDKEAALDALENCVVSQTGRWRHGHTETIVFQHENGEFYRTTIPIHSEDGPQFYGPIDAYRVIEQSKVTTEWVRPK